MLSAKRKKYAGPLPETAVARFMASSFLTSKLSVILFMNLPTRADSALFNPALFQTAMPSPTESPKFGIMRIIFLCPDIMAIFFSETPAIIDTNTVFLSR